jgi:hypothetical protein
MLTHAHNVIYLVVSTFVQGWWSWRSKGGIFDRPDSGYIVTGRWTWESGHHGREGAARSSQPYAAQWKWPDALVRRWCTLMQASEQGRGDRTHRCVRSWVTWHVRLRKISSGTSLELIWRREAKWSSASGQGSTWCARERTDVIGASDPCDHVFVRHLMCEGDQLDHWNLMNKVESRGHVAQI